jgi:hypothetical protein
VPSADEAIICQFLLLAVRLTHVTPESLDVHMRPENTTAASLTPSADEAIDCQPLPDAEVPVVLLVHTPLAKAIEKQRTNNMAEAMRDDLVLKKFILSCYYFA